LSFFISRVKKSVLLQISLQANLGLIFSATSCRVFFLLKNKSVASRLCLKEQVFKLVYSSYILKMNLTLCLRLFLILNSDQWSQCSTKIGDYQMCLCHPRGWQKCMPEAKASYCSQVKKNRLSSFFLRLAKIS